MSARMPTPSTELLRADAYATPETALRSESRREPRTLRGERQLSIERLCIEGIDLTSRQGEHLQGVIERELSRLLQARSLQFRSSAIARLRAPPLTADIGSDPNTLGTSIARSLFAAMRDDSAGDNSMGDNSMGDER